MIDLTKYLTCLVSSVRCAMLCSLFSSVCSTFAQNSAAIIIVGHRRMLIYLTCAFSFPLFSSLFSRFDAALSRIYLQIDKVIQLYETMLTRHCTMIVGPTGGGKTVVLSTLVKAQTRMGTPTRCITLNPKVSIYFTKFFSNC